MTCDLPKKKKCPTPLLFVRRNISIPGNAKFVDFYTNSNIFFYKQTQWYYKPYLQEQQQIVVKTRFSISSLHIGFGQAFPQN